MESFSSDLSNLSDFGDFIAGDGKLAGHSLDTRWTLTGHLLDSCWTPTRHPRRRQVWGRSLAWGKRSTYILVCQASAGQSRYHCQHPKEVNVPLDPMSSRVAAAIEALADRRPDLWSLSGVGASRSENVIRALLAGDAYARAGRRPRVLLVSGLSAGPRTSKSRSTYWRPGREGASLPPPSPPCHAYIQTALPVEARAAVRPPTLPRVDTTTTPTVPKSATSGAGPACSRPTWSSR